MDSTLGRVAVDTRSARALAPDLARGSMLALIAVANVMIYLHDRPYGLRQHIVEDGTADRIASAVIVTSVDGRAYPLFAALFGYGMVRIAQRQRGREGDPAQAVAVLRRRSRWLILLGLAHAAIGFSGDILGWYGLLGLLLASRLVVSDRTLLRWAAGWLVVASLIQGFIYSDPQVRDQRSFFWSFAIDDPVHAARWRLAEWLMTPFGLLSVVSAVLVGIWAGRRRLLEQVGPHRTLLRRTAAIGIGAGLLGGVGMALATVHLWHPPDPVLLVASWLHVLTGVLCGLGYAAALALLAARIEEQYAAGLPRVVSALRATGERSLSCYLAQTLVFVALLPAWTLGLGASLGTVQATGLALATWLLTVLAADRLAQHGRRGPAEALLSGLVYPSRRASAHATIQ